jgi:hypothetical protein
LPAERYGARSASVQNRCNPFTERSGVFQSRLEEARTCNGSSLAAIENTTRIQMGIKTWKKWEPLANQGDAQQDHAGDQHLLDEREPLLAKRSRWPRRAMVPPCDLSWSD